MTPLTQYHDEARKRPVLWSGPVLAGDRLLIAGTLGELLAVSPYTGEILGKMDLRDPMRLGPVIANRTIYVLTDSRAAHCPPLTTSRPSHGSPSSADPMSASRPCSTAWSAGAAPSSTTRRA